jgi:hypothetical protein
MIYCADCSHSQADEAPLIEMLNQVRGHVAGEDGPAMIANYGGISLLLELQRVDERTADLAQIILLEMSEADSVVKTAVDIAISKAWAHQVLLGPDHAAATRDMQQRLQSLLNSLNSLRQVCACVWASKRERGE